MAWWWKSRNGNQAPSQSQVDDRSLLERGRLRVGNSLARFKDDQAALEADIAVKAEHLRQTRIVISAFTEADRIISEGLHPSGARRS